MSWRNCTENQAPGQHLDHLLPEVAGNLLFRFLLCSLTWVTSLQTVGCIIFFSKWYPWKPKRVHVESFSNEFKMPERYDLWGSISTLHLVLEWCYVQQNDPPNAGREDYESYRYMIYIYIDTSCMSMILNMQNHGGKNLAFKSVRGHDIASQNTALLIRNHLKIDSNMFSVWSFHYENLNHLLFKRVILLGSRIKATSFLPSKSRFEEVPVDPGAHRRHRPPSSQAHPDPQQELLDGTWDMIDMVMMEIEYSTNSDAHDVLRSLKIPYTAYYSRCYPMTFRNMIGTRLLTRKRTTNTRCNRA